MQQHFHLTEKQYQELYNHSIQDPQSFWSDQAEKFITWSKKWDSVLTGNFEQLNTQWFVNGKLNVCYNCVDRHLPTRANQTAIIFEGDDPNVSQKISYAELHEKICR